MTMITDGERYRHELEIDLIHRALAGDRAAARELHSEYAPVALAFLRRLGTRPDELEDACQEVFLRFFRHLGAFRGESALKTWFYRLCATEARRARRSRRVAASIAQLLQRQPAAHAVLPAICSDATIAALVSRALAQMAPAQREAFILFAVEGLTGKEVARLAGHSLPSTFRRLYEAQRVVRKTLGVDRN
jgi:RNA polymerase sigma-70 factor (ECF subfamily)